MKFFAALAACLAIVNAHTEINHGKSVITRKNDASTDSSTSGPQSNAVVTNVQWHFSSTIQGHPPLLNHGGSVLQNTVNIYVIYYGDNFYGGQPQTAYPGALNNVLSGFGSGSSWYDQTRTIDSRVGQPTFYSHWVTQYNYGQTLTDSNIHSIIQDTLNQGVFPTDSNGIYLVITDSTVKESKGTSSYGTNYCGYHSNFNGLLYAFIGTGSPNCHAGPWSYNGGYLYAANGGDIDGMVSVALHEITEAITDPFGQTWFDSAGYENGDECNWQFGAANTMPGTTDHLYNLQVGSSYYMVQQNYNQNTQTCQQVVYTS